MHTLFKTAITLMTALSVTACVEVDFNPDALAGVGSGNGTPPQTGGTQASDARFNQTFSFNRGTGSSGVMVQTVKSGAGRPGLARVCFVNRGPVQTALTHGVPGINPLSAAPGGQSCANFSAGARVSFTLVEQLGIVPVPARSDRPFVYTLSPFDGDILELEWQAR